MPQDECVRRTGAEVNDCAALRQRCMQQRSDAKGGAIVRAHAAEAAVPCIPRSEELVAGSLTERAARRDHSVLRAARNEQRGLSGAHGNHLRRLSVHHVAETQLAARIGAPRIHTPRLVCARRITAAVATVARAE